MEKKTVQCFEFGLRFVKLVALFYYITRRPVAQCVHLMFRKLGVGLPRLLHCCYKLLKELTTVVVLMSASLEVDCRVHQPLYPFINPIESQ